ncbi:MAG TPA: hypothetical protein VEZ72_13930 [Paenibacillus sp.]|nr:hypothetical protein [Paenibacillus sp.]
MKRTIRGLFLLFLVLSVTACGSGSAEKPEISGDPAAGSGVAGTADSTDTTADEEETVVLKYAISADQASRQTSKDLMALVEKRLGNVRLEPLIIPGEGVDFNKKLTISLMAGDEIDIIYQNATTYQKFATANLIEPLDDYIRDTQYDVNKIYGSSISTFNDNIYMLPAFRDIHITMYNKDLFDAAKVPYPEDATWTWDKYVEAAKAITALGQDTYGSYMLDWDNYFMMTARQKKVPEYKEDGTSNYDDPAFAESLKFYADLGNEWKVQPDFLTFKSKKMPWDAFLTTGKYGLYVIGNWALQTAMDTNQYPREWKLGVAIMPQVTEGGTTVMGIMGGYSVSSTSKHKKEAFEAVKVLAEEQWTLPGIIPARVDLNEEDIQSIFQPMADALANDGITVEQLKKSILDPSLEIVNEKVVGPGMTQIATIIPSVGELYATNQISLEEAVLELKKQADQAIADDQAQP